MTKKIIKSGCKKKTFWHMYCRSCGCEFLDDKPASVVRDPRDGTSVAFSKCPECNSQSNGYEQVADDGE